MFKLILLVLSTSLLLGCGSTMSLSECQSVNWFDKGVTDGKAGAAVLQYDEYAKSCPNNTKQHREDYYSGYQDGIVFYCVPENGKERGKRGGQHHKACLKNVDYMTSYAEGLAIFVEERERREVEKLTRPSGNTQVGAATVQGSGSGNN